MRNTLVSLSVLLLSFMFLCLGHGLLNSLISVRAADEAFSNVSIGMMGVAYFGGFLVGIYLCIKFLVEVGHIRTFAALASVVSAIAVSFLLVINPISWIIFRFGYGICIAALYMVIESWLNAFSSHDNRGQVLSIYMILIYMSFSASQYLLILGNIEDFYPFIVVSILISISVVPLCLSPKAKPVELTMDSMPLKKLLNVSPYGSLSCFNSGLVVGSIWTMMGAFLAQNEFEASKISLYLSMTFLGALLMQYPLGKISDIRQDRRSVIRFTSFLGAGVFFLTLLFLSFIKFPITYIFLFLLIGGCTFPIYSLSMAHIIDHLEPKYIIKASGSLIWINSLGAMIGSLVCSLLMTLIAPNAFLVFGGVVLAVNGMLAFYVQPKETWYTTENTFVALPRTTSALHELDPRVPISTEEP